MTLEVHIAILPSPLHHLTTSVPSTDWEKFSLDDILRGTISEARGLWGSPFVQLSSAIFQQFLTHFSNFIKAQSLGTGTDVTY